MGKNSGIAWTDHTFNPWWGCAKVSPGCKHCYAATFAERVGHGKRMPTIWGADAERRPSSEKYWREPLAWNREAEREGVRRRVFCASMADVFEHAPGRNEQANKVMRDGRARLFRTIEATPGLDWLLLTKRPQNVAHLVPWGGELGPWPRNVWIGTTVENQAMADERLPYLLALPARVRFVSHEPALEAVRLPPCGPEWIITGGESGAHARPYDLAWARQMIEHGERYGVAVFVKQLGARPIGHAHKSISLRDRAGADPAEWPEDLVVQQFPEVS